MSEILTNQKKNTHSTHPRTFPLTFFLFNGLTVPQTLDGMYHRHMFTTTKQPLDALERAPHHRYDGLLVNGDEVDRLGAAGHSDMEQFSPQRPGTPAHVDTATPVPESAPLLLVQPTHTVLTHRQQLFQSASSQYVVMATNGAATKNRGEVDPWGPRISTAKRSQLPPKPGRCDDGSP